MQRSCVTCLSISTRRTKHTRLVLFEHLRAVWFAIHVYTISMHHRRMQLAAVTLPSWAWPLGTTERDRFTWLLPQRHSEKFVWLKVP
jgi:hypothetical protein